MAKANKFRFNKKPTSYQLVGDLIKSSDVFSDLREVLDSNYIRRKDKSYYVRYGEIQQVIAELHPDYKNVLREIRCTKVLLLAHRVG